MSACGTSHRTRDPEAFLRLTLVSPEFPFSGKVPIVPPILEYLGALTLREAPDAELELVDANQRPVAPEAVRGEVVGISVWTATAPWAYRFADRCRAAGKKVVLGGIHASACPEEAALHADSVVVGEAESCWGEVLRDAGEGRLRPRYQGVQLPLDGLPQPIDAQLRGNYQFRAFFTMRGCPYSCTFCSVHQFFGNRVRYRPVDEVVAEIEARAGSIWFNGDDNIWGADPTRATALFDALATRTRPRSWYGFGDLRSLEGPDGDRMLAAAARSGLFSVWVGWESDSPETLRAYRAGGKQGGDRVATVRRIQDHGVGVTLFCVLGGRTEGRDQFLRTIELADRLGVGVHPVLLTPLPGTPLFEAYRPHLLPALGWEAFTGVRAVFEHPDPAMTPRAREAAYHELCRELFRPARVASRVLAIPSRQFPKHHLLTIMETVPMGIALGKARAEWARAAREDPAGAACALLPPPPRRARLRRAIALAWLTLLALLAGAHLDAVEALAARAYPLLHDGIAAAAATFLALLVAALLHHQLTERRARPLPPRALCLRRLGTAVWIGAGAALQLALSL
jgi:hypothetical protein